jgi:ADP-ribose pyrophosphatase
MGKIPFTSQHLEIIPTRYPAEYFRGQIFPLILTSGKTNLTGTRCALRPCHGFNRYNEKCGKCLEKRIYKSKSAGGMSMKPWETLSKEIVLDMPPFLRVEAHKIELPDGRVIEDWAWLITPDFIVVVVITENDEYLCFRQTKYSVEGTTLALVGGYINDEEKPLTAAKRELLEETGYKAEQWESLGQYAVDGSRGNGSAHLFLARGAHKVRDPETDDLEEQVLLKLTRAEAEAAVARGAFKVIPWQAAMAMALLRC